MRPRPVRRSGRRYRPVAEIVPASQPIRLRSPDPSRRDSGGWLADMMRSAGARSAKVDESLPPSQLNFQNHNGLRLLPDP
jgi:hypothetical protein